MRSADRLDLEFRMPLTWPVCREGRAEVGIARKVAGMARHLPLAAMAVVDRAIARIIASESGGRVLTVTEARSSRPTPELHQQRVEAERRKRYVPPRAAPTSSGCAR